MASKERPTARNVPLPIAREVRQRCGFGCVMCGMPLYEYEHLLGWANVKRHVAEEITLLCDQHHRERTNSLLTEEQVRAADADPHNLRQGVSKPYDLHFTGEECRITVGSNSFTTRDTGHGTICVPISIDGVPLIGFVLSDGHLLLNINLFDERNNCFLRIVNNVLFYSVEPWDITLVGRTLTIRSGQGAFLTEMRFEPPNGIEITRGRLLRNGVELLVRPSFALLINNRTLLSGCSATNVPVGLALGVHDDLPQTMIVMQGINRYIGDRTAAQRWAKEQMREFEDR
jgi:hypothetical protein